MCDSNLIRPFNFTCNTFCVVAVNRGALLSEGEHSRGSQAAHVGAEGLRDVDQIQFLDKAGVL